MNYTPQEPLDEAMNVTGAPPTNITVYGHQKSILEAIIYIERRNFSKADSWASKLNRLQLVFETHRAVTECVHLQNSCHMITEEPSMYSIEMQAYFVVKREGKTQPCYLLPKDLRCYIIAETQHVTQLIAVTPI